MRHKDALLVHLKESNETDNAVLPVCVPDIDRVHQPFAMAIYSWDSIWPTILIWNFTYAPIIT